MLLAAALAVSLSGPTRAASECSYAAQSYHTAVVALGSTLRRYATCIEGSRAENDCSVEFRLLKSAQDDFENAFSEFQSSCE